MVPPLKPAVRPYDIRDMASLGRRRYLAGAVLLVSLAGCGGGGGAGSAAALPPPLPAPTLAPTLAPSSTASVTLGTQPSVVTLPAIAGGVSASLQVAAASATGAHLTATLSAAAPSGVPAPASVGRIPRTIGASPLDPIAFVALSADAGVTLTAVPGPAFSVPGTVTAPNGFWLALYDATNPAAGWTTVAGPVSPASGAVTFPAGTKPLTLRAGAGDALLLFAPGGVFPTPSPAPIPTATPASVAVASAPVVGPLSASGGGFAGVTSASYANATVVGYATGLQASNRSAVTRTGSVTLTASATTQQALRRPESEAPDPGFARLTVDRLPDPGAVRALRGALRRAPPGERAAGADRRARTLATTIGAQTLLWAQNASLGSGNGSYAQVAATLGANTAHGQIWIDSSLTTLLADPSAVAQIATDFENAYASDTTSFGDAAYTANYAPSAFCSSSGVKDGTSGSPYVASGPIVVFVVNPSSLGNKVGGYFDGVNFFPQGLVNCFSTSVHSNEVPMIYVGWFSSSGTSYETQEDLVRGTAHELQHLINFVQHDIVSATRVDEDPFINEGLSMLAQDLAVPALFPSLHNDVADAAVHGKIFLQHPEHYSLTGFSGVDPASITGDGVTPAYNCFGCYGGSYLFQRYLYDRFGSAYLHEVETGAIVGSGFQQLAAKVGESPSQLLAEFGIALAANGAASDARYALPHYPFGTTAVDQLGTLHLIPTTGVVGGAGTYAAPYDGGFAFWSLPAGGDVETVREASGLTFGAGISQH